MKSLFFRPLPGVDMKIKICPTAFDPWEEIRDYQRARQTLASQYGATTIFIGTMRDYNEGESIRSMVLEHYPGMTEKQLENIIADAVRRWRILDVFVAHRVGEIRPDEAIVLAAVWSAHRGDAFDACRHIMEELKANAPFWKKETLISGQTRWVEKNSDGYA